MSNNPPHYPPSYADARGRADERFGTALSSRATHHWDLAAITAYDAATQTYRVQGQRMGALTDLPRLLRSPGDTSLLPLGTLVAIHDELGFWVIDAVVKFPSLDGANLKPTQITEVRGVGGEDPVYTPNPGAASHRSPSDPLDMLHGDQVTASPDGNLMGVLLGGMNVMKSSPMAQIRTHALQDLVEIVSATYRHITSMGDLRVVNDGGKTSLIWRATSDQARAGDWSIRLDVGATGDLFNLEVTTAEGNTLARVHLSADGRLELTGVAGVDVTSGDKGPRREDVAGDQVTQITGTQNLRVKGQAQAEYRNTRTTSVSKNDDLTVGNDQRTTVSNNRYAYVGGVAAEKVQGGTAPSADTVAKNTQIINGHCIVDLANPALGAAPNKQNEIHVNWAGGTYFVLMSSAGGPISLVTTKNDSIHLGATGTAVPNPTTGGYDIQSVAPFTAMLFEYFESMMKTFLELLDKHTHGSAVGPTSPPIIPAKPIIEQLLPLIKSKRVKIGL